jgi:hypothetical protein
MNICLKFFETTGIIFTLAFLSACGGGGGSTGSTHSWTGRTLLETDDSGDAESAKIAFDVNGNALAVWHQSDGTYFHIWAKRYTPATGWRSVPQRIDTDDIGDSKYPDVQLDASGNAIAVWQQKQGLHELIGVNHYSATTGWGLANLLSGGPVQTSNPKIAVASNGNAIAVWEQAGVSGDFDIYARFYNSGVWESLLRIENNGAYDDTAPQIAIDSASNALVVWQHYTSNSPPLSDIWANRFTQAGGWQTPQLLEADVRTAGNAQIAMTPDGDAIAVWAQGNYPSSSDVFANRFTPSSNSWGLPEAVDSATIYSQAENIAIGNDGSAIAVWKKTDSTGTYIWANRYIPGTGWGAAEQISDISGAMFGSPQVAIDPAGNTITVWAQSDGTNVSIWSNRYTPTSDWGTPELLENSVGDARDPQIAMDDSGRAIAVWKQTNGTTYSIYANTYE